MQLSSDELKSLEALTQQLNEKTALCDKLVAGLHQVGEQIKYLQDNIPIRYKVLCSNILLTISEILALPYRNELFLSRGTRQRAVLRRKTGTILPSVYNRIHGSANTGIQIRDFILIHSFLNSVCVESSETQHLPSMLFPILCFSFFSYVPEKVLRHVSEVSDIESPLYTDLLPPTKETQPLSLKSYESRQSIMPTSSTSEDRQSEPSLHRAAQPLFLYFLTEAGKQFLYTVLGGDEDLLNGSYKSCTDHPLVCVNYCFQFSLYLFTTLSITKILIWFTLKK